MGFATLALLTLCTPTAAMTGQDMTDAEAVEVFVELAKDKKAVPDLLIFGVDDLEKRYAASMDRGMRAFERLETGEGKAAEWKKIIKNEEGLQEDIAEGVWAVFRYRKKVTDQHMTVWRRALTAFGKMPRHGSEYLWKVFEDKRFSRDGGFRGRCVQEVGRTKDFSQYEELLDLLDFHLEDVVVGAGNALRFYGEAPGKIRRDCTEKLVKAVESYRSRSNGGENIDGPRVWGKVKGPLMAALQSITGQNIKTSLDWTKFWNNNKNNKAMWKDA